MKIRSKALFDHLLEAGVLNGTPEQIACAKQAYRREYKRNYKKRERSRKEIRFEVTLKQYAVVAATAYASALKPTSFARQTLLCAANAGIPAITKDELLSVLQSVSLAYNALRGGSIHKATTLIYEAEIQLLHIQKKMA